MRISVARSLFLLTLVVTVSYPIQGGTLLIANKTDNTADLVDVDSGASVATLPTGSGPHEVAVSRDGRTAVISNYGHRGKPGSTLTVIDVGGAR